MDYQNLSPFDCTVEELDRELIARGVKTPPPPQFTFPDNSANPTRSAIFERLKSFYHQAGDLHPHKGLEYVCTQDLIKILKFKTGQLVIDGVRGTHGKDCRLDYFDIKGAQEKSNAHSTVAVFHQKDLIDYGNGTFGVEFAQYGAFYDLCPKEQFRDQPIARGDMFSGVLVHDDIVATAGHKVLETPVERLCFVFGFRMNDTCRAPSSFPRENIYRGVELLHHSHNFRCCDTPDWALIRLDRKVTHFPVATVAPDHRSRGNDIYVIGHPMGLPLKFAPDANILARSGYFFNADLDVYCGSSGSPVFDARDHHVVGLVSRGHSDDFRWVDGCLTSVIYPQNLRSDMSPRCTDVSAFAHILQNYCE